MAVIHDIGIFIYHSRAGGMCLHIKITFRPTNNIGPRKVIYLKDQTYCLGLSEISYFI